MSGRYLGAILLFAGVLAVAAFVVAALVPAVAAWQLLLPALAAYALGVAFDVLPPGRPQRGAGAAADADRGDATGPLLVPGPRALDEGPLWTTYIPIDEPPAGRGMAATLVVAAIGLSLAAGAVVAWLAASGSGGPQAGSAPETPAPTEPARTASRTATRAPAPTATPTETATATPTATATATARPQPTPVPPTATRAGPTPTTPARQGDLSGRWQIVDTVTNGPGANETYTFTVQLQQAGSAISGSGGGLTLAGERQGDRVVVAFERSGGTGYFIWTAQGNNLLTGTFRDNGAGNGGTSIARRLE